MTSITDGHPVRTSIRKHKHAKNKMKHPVGEGHYGGLRQRLLKSNRDQTIMDLGILGVFILSLIGIAS